MRVLWHGAWRARGRKKGDAPDAADDAPKATPAKDAPGVAANRRRPSPPTTRSWSTRTILCAARLANEFVAALQANGAKGRVIAGRTSPTALAKAVQSDSADLAIAPIDALIADDKATADWRERAPYIARLGAETVEIIAPRAVVDVRQLDGRDVGFGVADGAAAATAATLFARLGVAPKPSFAPLAPALADLAAGKIAAVVAVGAKSSKTLADFGKDGRFHVVAIPWSPSLRPLYAPARLTAKDRPNLIGADEKIDTLGAPMALIALDAASVLRPRRTIRGADQIVLRRRSTNCSAPTTTRAGATSTSPPPRRGRACGRRRRGSISTQRAERFVRRVPRGRQDRDIGERRSRRRGFRSSLRQSDAMARRRTMTRGTPCRSC